MIGKFFSDYNVVRAEQGRRDDRETVGGGPEVPERRCGGGGVESGDSETDKEGIA